MNAIFYLNGKNFHLRGIQEQSSLALSQIKRFSNPDRYEHGSKNHNGGVNDLSQGKIVPIVGINSSRCHVAMLDLYLRQDFFQTIPLSLHQGISSSLDDSGYMENPDSSFKEEDLAVFNYLVMYSV